VTYVSDTHALVWYLTADGRLSGPAQAALADAAAEIIVPAIVLAEIHYLHAKGRIPLDLATTIHFIGSSQNASVYPLNEVVAQRLPPTLNIHVGLVVATALVLRDMHGKKTTVITRDAAIKSSGLIQVCW
jgi:PIN domain nuclease of toxin-antitoxin system